MKTLIIDGNEEKKVEIVKELLDKAFRADIKIYRIYYKLRPLNLTSTIAFKKEYQTN